MMKPRTKSIKALTFSAALCASLGLSFSANAETIEVQKLKHAGQIGRASCRERV